MRMETKLSSGVTCAQYVGLTKDDKLLVEDAVSFASLIVKGYAYELEATNQFKEMTDDVSEYLFKIAHSVGCITLGYDTLEEYNETLEELKAADNKRKESEPHKTQELIQ